MANTFMTHGRLGQDPELKQSTKGTNFCTFSIAERTSEFSAQTKKYEEGTNWWNCQAWGKQAETIAKHFCTGKPIIVSGTLRTWKSNKTTSDGKPITMTTLNVSSWAFLERDSTEEKGAGGGDVPFEVPGGGGEGLDFS